MDTAESYDQNISLRQVADMITNHCRIHKIHTAVAAHMGIDEHRLHEVDLRPLVEPNDQP